MIAGSISLILLVSHDLVAILMQPAQLLIREPLQKEPRMKLLAHVLETGLVTRAAPVHSLNEPATLPAVIFVFGIVLLRLEFLELQRLLRLMLCLA